jgi:hypothetical protein
MKTIHLRKQSGSSLVVVISVLATLMVVVGVAAEYTWTVNRHVQRSNTLERAVAVGDSSLEMLFANWRAICSSAPTTLQPTSAFASIATPTSSQFPDIPGFAATATDYYDNNTPNPPTVSNYKVVAANAEWQALAGPGATPIPMLGQIAAAVTAGTPPPPTTPLVYNYVASADVTLPALGPTGTVVAKVRRVFQKQQLSPWNFAIFYVDPLEIHPGPQFTVTGWVHTNSDLYTGHNTLTFADKVTYGSDWFVGFKPGDGTHPETPSAPLYPSNLPPARAQAMQPFGLDSTSIFSTTDANPNNDSYHELIEPPNILFTDPLAGQRYWDQAGIIVQVSDNPNSNAPGFDHINGHDLVNFFTVNQLTGVTTQITNGSLYNTFSANGVITTNQTIQDNREVVPSVRLATLDISKLENSSNTNTPSWKQTFNNIVYIYDTSATPSARRGIRLKNGATIPSLGLTVASNNPVYIQGDFNVGIGTVPSNSTTNNDPTKPQATDTNGNPLYTRAPTSVVADAVTILSNNWNDNNAQSGDPLTARVATNTTVNTAIIAGIVPSAAPVTGDGSYSGGAENFPRFLEAWDNVYFTYYGSMVELYKSQQAIGEWSYGGNVYGAPNRQWYFDNNFKIKPPPGSLMLFSYIKGKWSVL